MITDGLIIKDDHSPLCQEPPFQHPQDPLPTPLPTTAPAEPQSQNQPQKATYWFLPPFPTRHLLSARQQAQATSSYSRYQTNLVMLLEIAVCLGETS